MTLSRAHLHQLPERKWEDVGNKLLQWLFLGQRRAPRSEKPPAEDDDGVTPFPPSPVHNLSPARCREGDNGDDVRRQRPPRSTITSERHGELATVRAAEGPPPSCSPPLSAPAVPSCSVGRDSADRFSLKAPKAKLKKKINLCLFFSQLTQCAEKYTPT